MIVNFIPHHSEIPQLETEEYFMLQMEVEKKIEDVETTPPKNIVFAVDTSGSMALTFHEMRRCLSLALHKLRPEDSVSILSYNSTVEIICEWNHCSEGFLKTVDQKLKDLQCNGGTNISGALLKCVEQSMKKDEPVTVIFFTDGHANLGVTDINSLGIMAKKLIPENAVVHTLGFHKDHNPLFLKKISEVCNNGTYFFIENEDSLQGALLEIMGKTFEVVYQNMSVELQSDGMIFHQDDKPIQTLSLGDMHLGEKKRWLVKGSFVEMKESYDINLTTKAYNVIGMSEFETKTTEEVKRGDTNVLNKDVQTKIDLTNAANAVKRAAEAVSKRKFKYAQSLVREASASLRGLPTVQKNLNNLVNEFHDEDEDILSTSCHRLTSYQDELNHSDSLFNGTPSQHLGLSPIKTPTKKINFFPEEDEPGTVKRWVFSDSTAQTLSDSTQ